MDWEDMTLQGLAALIIVWVFGRFFKQKDEVINSVGEKASKKYVDEKFKSLKETLDDKEIERERTRQARKDSIFLTIKSQVTEVKNSLIGLFNSNLDEAEQRLNASMEKGFSDIKEVVREGQDRNEKKITTLEKCFEEYRAYNHERENNYIAKDSSAVIFKEALQFADNILRKKDNGMGER